jgi:hypothetical protein
MSKFAHHRQPPSPLLPSNLHFALCTLHFSTSSPSSASSGAGEGRGEEDQHRGCYSLRPLRRSCSFDISNLKSQIAKKSAFSKVFKAFQSKLLCSTTPLTIQRPASGFQNPARLEPNRTPGILFFPPLAGKIGKESVKKW